MMISALLLACAGLTDEPATQKVFVRYVRPAGDKYVPESQITVYERPDGTTCVSRTGRGAETMVLTVVRDRQGKLVRSDIEHTKDRDTRKASVEWQGGKVKLTRGGITEMIETPVDAIVTTAPDWTDIFELVRRYDKTKAGKQAFPGLWFHPTSKTLHLTFKIEHVGDDVVKVKDAEQKLDRYRIQLRSGGYTVWAGPDGIVCKILPDGDKATPIVLAGYEEAVKALK